jgi:hypothetical protein
MDAHLLIDITPNTFNTLSHITTSRPPATMDNPSQSPQPKFKGFCTYVVIIHIRDATHTDDFPTVSGVFKEAVRCLRNQREQI